MTDTTPAEVEIVAGGPAVDETAGMPLPAIRCDWFPVRMVRTSRLKWLRDAVVDADDEVTAFADEAEKWFAEYAEQGDRADQAEERLDASGRRVADLEQQVEELSRRLAEAGVEAEHMNRSFRAVCDERDEERAARLHLQAAGRDITAAFTSENREADPMLDAIGRVLIRNAHRFDLGTDTVLAPRDDQGAASVEDEEQAELIRAAYRYPHDSTEPAIIADHLPHCEACTEALPTVDVEALTLAYRYALHSDHWRAVDPLRAEADRRYANRTATVGKEITK